MPDSIFDTEIHFRHLKKSKEDIPNKPVSYRFVEIREQN